MSRKLAENIKMVIIVVLFLTTILLLYLIWGGSNEVKVSDLIPSFEKESEETLSWGNPQPDKAYCSKGDGSFLCISDTEEVLNMIIEKFRELSDRSTVMSTEITKDQFEEAISKHASLIAEFSYTLPFSDYCEYKEIGGSGAYENIGSINEICFSSAATDSLLIANTQTEKYYRLVSDSVSLTFEEVAAQKHDYNCYEVSSILGVGEGKLFPLLTRTYQREGSCKDENIFSEEERLEIAKKVFGDGIDFVRRISDSFGNYTYMYGFGEKTLTLGINGSVEYKAELSQGNSEGIFEDLKTAKDFARNLGILDESSISSASLKLKNVEQSGSGKSASYNFCFVLTADSYEICGVEKYALEISVEYGKVSRLKSNIVPVDFSKEEETAVNVMDAANVLAANAKSSENFIRIAENYKNMDQVYFMKDGKLLPAWRLTLMDGSVFCYDIFTGELLN